MEEQHTVTLWIPTKPRTHPRPRAQPGGGQSYMPKEYKDHIDECLDLIAEQRAAGVPVYRISEEQIYVGTIVRPNGYEIFVSPTNQPRAKGLRGDLDNYQKTVWDLLQAAGIVSNDRFITHGVALFGSEEMLRDRLARSTVEASER